MGTPAQSAREGGAHVWRAVSSLDSVHSGASSNDARRREPEARGDRDMPCSASGEWATPQRSEWVATARGALGSRISVRLLVLTPHTSQITVHLYWNTVYRLQLLSQSESPTECSLRESAEFQRVESLL